MRYLRRERIPRQAFAPAVDRSSSQQQVIDSASASRAKGIVRIDRIGVTQVLEHDGPLCSDHRNTASSLRDVIADAYPRGTARKLDSSSDHAVGPGRAHTNGRRIEQQSNEVGIMWR